MTFTALKSLVARSLCHVSRAEDSGEQPCPRCMADGERVAEALWPLVGAEQEDVA